MKLKKISIFRKAEVDTFNTNRQSFFADCLSSRQFLHNSNKTDDEQVVVCTVHLCSCTTAVAVALQLQQLYNCSRVRKVNGKCQLNTLLNKRSELYD